MCPICVPLQMRHIFILTSCTLNGNFAKKNNGWDHPEFLIPPLCPHEWPIMLLSNVSFIFTNPYCAITHIQGGTNCQSKYIMRSTVWEIFRWQILTFGGMWRWRGWMFSQVKKVWAVSYDSGKSPEIYTAGYKVHLCCCSQDFFPITKVATIIRSVAPFVPCQLKEIVFSGKRNCFIMALRSSPKNILHDI